MPSEVRSFTATIPAGTLQSAPITIDLSFPARKVVELHALVPDGPNGTMGFQIASSNVPVIPYNPGQWIVTSGENLTWEMSNYPDTGSWQLIGYNTGKYSHAIQLRFMLDYVTTGAPTDTPPLLSAIDLSSIDSASLTALTAVTDTATLGD